MIDITVTFHNVCLHHGREKRPGRRGVCESRGADRRPVWVVLVSLGQGFEDGVDLLSDGRQGKLKLVLEPRRQTSFLHIKSTMQPVKSVNSES